MLIRILNNMIYNVDLKEMISIMSDSVGVFSYEGKLLFSNKKFINIFSVQGKKGGMNLFSLLNTDKIDTQDDNYYSFLFNDINLGAKIHELKTSNGIVLLLIIKDILINQDIISDIINDSYIDPLTKVYNKKYLNKFINEELYKLTFVGNKVGIYFCDLNKFKQINDQYGHNVGDIVLGIVGQRLRESFRINDFIFRIGGDEFIILAEMSENDIESVSKKIISIIEIPMHLTDIDNHISISVSIGCGTIDTSNDINLLKIIQKVDQQMYIAKKNKIGYSSVLINNIN